MVLPRRIRPLTRLELEHLNVDRLIAYRKTMLGLENSLAASDYADIANSLDKTYIWFKDDPRWQLLYDSLLEELGKKQKRDSSKRTNQNGLN